MNFCTCGVIFVLLAMLKHKLWQHKVKKMRRFLCTDMVDFCRRGHNYGPNFLLVCKCIISLCDTGIIGIIHIENEFTVCLIICLCVWVNSTASKVLYTLFIIYPQHMPETLWQVKQLIANMFTVATLLWASWKQATTSSHNTAYHRCIYTVILTWVGVVIRWRLTCVVFSWSIHPWATCWHGNDVTWMYRGQWYDITYVSLTLRMTHELTHYN